jgi:hypothetical protein
MRQARSRWRAQCWACQPNRHGLDFTDAKPVAQTPVLAGLQAAHGGKSRITIRVDNATLVDLVRETQRQRSDVPNSAALRPGCATTRPEKDTPEGGEENALTAAVNPAETPVRCSR